MENNQPAAGLQNPGNVKPFLRILLAGNCVMMFIASTACGSIAMMADAVYMFIALSQYTAIMVGGVLTVRKPNINYPLGYHQAIPTLLLTSVLVSWLIIAYLLKNCFVDIRDPTDTHYTGILFFSMISAGIQYFTTLHKWNTDTEQGFVILTSVTFAEAVVDSFARKIAIYNVLFGLIMSFINPVLSAEGDGIVSEWNILDPFICLIYMGREILFTIQTCKMCINRLTLHAPKSVSHDVLERSILQNCVGVKDVQDIRHFSIGNEIIMYCQLAVGKEEDEENILFHAREAVAKHGVTQSTFQFNKRKK